LFIVVAAFEGFGMNARDEVCTRRRASKKKRSLGINYCAREESGEE
jgi:hypothetical protein